MDEKTVLLNLGLSEGEAKVYLSLLKLGPSPVSEITKDTGQHRTTVYDFLDHLLEKGLVNYVIKEGVKYYKVSPPEKFQELLKEKEENLKLVMPRLKELAEFSKEELSVEVYKGKEGLKTFLKDIIKQGKDLYAFGIDETKFESLLPLEMKRFFKAEKEKKIKEFILAEKGTKFVYKTETTNYRFIPKEFFSPTPIAVYHQTLALIIWEPLTVILIKNKSLAEAFRKYHQLLWSIAKK